MATKRNRDANGYITIKRNPISKVGVFPYRGEMIDHPEAKPGKTYKVLRPASTLKKAAESGTFAHIPWIDDHKECGAEYGNNETKASGITLDKCVFDGVYLYNDLKLYDATLLGKIDDKKKKDLSPAYKATYDHAPGNFEGEDYDFIQTEMIGNHLASVQRGRTGKDVCVYDNKDCILTDATDAIALDFGYIANIYDENAKTAIVFDYDDMNKNDEGDDMPFTKEQQAKIAKIVSDSTEDANSKFLEQLNKMQQQLDAIQNKSNDNNDGDDNNTDKNDGVLNITEQELKDKIDAAKNETAESAKVAADAAINEAIKDLGEASKLAEDASILIGKFDHHGKTTQEVANYIANHDSFKSSNLVGDTDDTKNANVETVRVLVAERISNKGKSKIAQDNQDSAPAKKLSFIDGL